jgi:hypothetical protein
LEQLKVTKGPAGAGFEECSARDQLFSGSRLTFDQHGLPKRAEALDGLDNLAQAIGANHHAAHPLDRLG